MRTLTTIFLLLFALFPISSAPAGETEQESPFSYNIRTLLFADVQYPANSTQNPDNAFLQLYRYSGEFDLRPDFFWEQSSLSAVFKPRFTASRLWWEDGIMKGTTDSPSRAFVNEWRVQAKPVSSLFLSFGKEKLLWGPSFLASPSNILFKDTEKLNPKVEVEGKYLAKAIIVPNNTLTVNVITETGNDKNDLGETLKPLRLIKADVVGSNYQVSLIGYHRQDDRFRFGSYGQWTASDALVLYYDGIVSKGTDALYPVPDPASPLGGSFAKKNENSSELFTTVTAGGSYTFLSGSILSMEFLYNGQGYSDADAAEYYRLRQNASDHFFDAGPLSVLSQMTLNESLNNGTSFLRRYYLMGQYQVREIKNVLDVIVRYTHSLEEHAGQASSIIEWQLTNRIQFFNINIVGVNAGGNTEYNSIISQSYMAGIEVHF
jgi:hypothetical protein